MTSHRGGCKLSFTLYPIRYEEGLNLPYYTLSGTAGRGSLIGDLGRGHPDRDTWAGSARYPPEYLRSMSNTFDIDEVTEQVINWLRANYPLPKVSTNRVVTKAQAPELRWERMPKDWYGAVSGEQHNTVLLLNTRVAYSIESLVDSICHEWCHLLQDMKLYNWYSRRLKAGYWKHPLEIEAREFAARLWAEVFSTRYSRCEASLESGSES